MADAPSSDAPKLTSIGWLVILAVIGGCFYGAYVLFAKKPAAPGAGAAPSPSSAVQNGGGASATPPGPVVHIGVAYGTEKSLWFREAVEQFSHAPEGAGIQVELIPQGSVEAADLIVSGSVDAQKINVWCPANSLPKAKLAGDWQAKYGSNPILNDIPENQLALTPMVFVFWEDRYRAFAQKYKTVSFQTVGEALAEPGGWDTIAQKPDWGLFKFGHTHPNKSNSGMMTLLLMAYDFKGTPKNVTLKDVLDPEFRKWMDGIERASSGMRESTGDMMREMVLKGPSSYDALFVYESVAIDYIRQAQGRWGRLHVEYPKYNAWNDNPYYVLDAPWSSREQRTAAETFRKFLLGDAMQKLGLQHGFRPGNLNVPVLFPESPFVVYQGQGLKSELGTIVEDPQWEVAFNLVQGWLRSQGNR